MDSALALKFFRGYHSPIHFTCFGHSWTSENRYFQSYICTCTFFKDHNLKVTQLLDIHHQWTFDQLLWWYNLDKIWLLAWYIETLVGKFRFWILCSLEKSPRLATVHLVTAEEDEPYIFFWSGVRVGFCWIYVHYSEIFFSNSWTECILITICIHIRETCEVSCSLGFLFY